MTDYYDDDDVIAASDSSSNSPDLYTDPLQHPPYPEYFEEDEVELDSSLDNVVVVDGVPITKVNRFEKLCTVLRKVFSEYGRIAVDGLYVPLETVNDEQQTCGMAFVEYESPEDALRAVQNGNGRRLDNAHVFTVFLQSDLQKYDKMKTEFTMPSRADFDAKSNLSSWLIDSLGRDQFVVRHGSHTQVYWHDPHRHAQDFGRSYVYGGEREAQNQKSWTELYVAWSVRGTYFVTFHEPGLVLWGGDQFSRIGRLVHGGVTHISFSPNEKFVLTYNHKTSHPKNDPKPSIVHAWDTRILKTPLRSFEVAGPQDESRWPFYKWSHDDAYFATVNKEAIMIYETPSMALVDKKSVKINNVTSIEFSPSDNLLAYCIPSEGTQPATIAIMSVPSKQTKREKHVFNVTEVALHWQSEGDFMCAQVTRRKQKKVTTTNLEIFRLRDRDVPIDTVELDTTVTAFAWEPRGSRFAVLHTDATNKVAVSLYKVEEKKITKLITIADRPANRLMWSPSGNFIVFLGLESLKGQLEFYDADNLESLATNEHFNCNHVAWDPSGRYLCTAVVQKIHDSNFRFSMDNGYRMWSMQGQLLATVPLDKAYQVLWRPRPPTPLTKQQRQALKKSFKDKYSRRFEAEDEEIRRSQLQGAEKERADQLAQWRVYRAQRDSEFNKQRAARRALRNGYASDDDELVATEVEVEEELSREEEVVA